MFKEQRIIQKFENAFAKFVGTKYAVSCNSGCSALFLSLKSLGIGVGDEVIVPDYTFIATATAVSLTGATPVFVDVKEDATINSNLIKITSKTKAIIPVHLYARKADLCKKFKLPIIEDCAEAIGTKGVGKTIGCWSFHYSKTLSTEQGGMITTNSKRIADLCRKYGSYWKNDKNCYLHQEISYCMRMTSLQAQMGLKGLTHLTNKLARFKIKGDRLSKKYSEKPQDNYWVFVSKNLKKGKPAFVPLHMQPPYKQKGEFPMSEKLYRELKYIYL